MRAHAAQPSRAGRGRALFKPGTTRNPGAPGGNGAGRCAGGAAGAAAPAKAPIRSGSHPRAVAWASAERGVAWRCRRAARRRVGGWVGGGGPPAAPPARVPCSGWSVGGAVVGEALERCGAGKSDEAPRRESCRGERAVRLHRRASDRLGYRVLGTDTSGIDLRKFWYFRMRVV